MASFPLKNYLHVSTYDLTGILCSSPYLALQTLLMICPLPADTLTRVSQVLKHTKCFPTKCYFFCLKTLSPNFHKIGFCSSFKSQFKFLLKSLFWQFKLTSYPHSSFENILLLSFLLLFEIYYYIHIFLHPLGGILFLPTFSFRKDFLV